MAFKPISVVALVLVAAGCATAQPSTHIESQLRLTEVQRPSDVVQRWGEYEISRSPDGVRFVDDLVEIRAVPDRSMFVLHITNRTEHTIRLPWDEAGYVGFLGRSSGVVPGNVSWANIDQPQPPEVIPSGATAQLTAIPRSLADREARTFRGFVPSELNCEQVEGVEVRLLLPLTVEGVIQEYTLSFHPTNAQVVETQRRHPAQPPREVGRRACQ